MTNRRTFLLAGLPAAVAVLATTRVAWAQTKAPERVSEKDPAAVPLGYHEDASKVDPKKFPGWQKGRVCSGCQLYQGKPTDAYAGCGVFGGKQVNGKGWCTAWAKKA